MKKATIFLFFLALNTLISADFDWPFLDNKAIGARQFIEKNPECDGRGTIIFILDSGVDPMVPGLMKTSTGKTKVVEMQDFSRQLVIGLEEAETDSSGTGKKIKKDNTEFTGLNKLTLKPADGIYYIGEINEKESFRNSGVKDINNNGKTDDVFPVLAFAIKNGAVLLKDAPGLVKPDKDDEVWVYYIDEDADGDFSDELPRFDYKYRYDTFDFNKNGNKALPLMTFSANINGSVPELIINTCDGPHGTHCSGIAAGYKIYGSEGNTGIAPGAYIASLKIGNNELSGGSTTTGSMKEAYEYGIEFMEEAGFSHAVFSMSYGIGSEYAGTSDIDKFLDKFSLENPEVVIVTSNGNSGPGINTTGNPTGNYSILNAGAMIPVNTLRDLYGSLRKEDWITHFSSRGGEIARPDVMAPGAASSTVPPYAHGNRYWGTSMACPEVAGACAVLISAAEKDGLDFNGFMIRKAVKYTSSPMKGYSVIDYGNGLVNIPPAFEYLKILSARDDINKAAAYITKTENTYYPGMKGSAIFWKSAGYFPGSGEKQNVSVNAVFDDDITDSASGSFYRVFRLKSGADWLTTDKSKFYLNAGDKNNFSVIFDKNKLDKPGIYSAKIYAYTAEEENGGNPEFDVQATIVIPYKFNEENNYRLNLKDKKLGIGDLERIYVEVPPGASFMNIRIKPSGSKHFGMAMYVFRPDGEEVFYENASGNNDTAPIECSIGGDKLDRGIWEIIPYCYFESLKPSEYDIEISFSGIRSNPELVSRIKNPADNYGRGKIRLFNEYDKPVSVAPSGEIEGFVSKTKHSVKNVSSFKTELSARDDIDNIRIRIDMPAEEYNKMTDIAVNVLDRNGKAIFTDGLERKSLTFNFTPPGPGKYTLEIVPAFISDEVKAKDWKFSVEKKYYYKEPVDIEFDKEGYILYPGVSSKIGFKLTSAMPSPPDKTKTFGAIILEDLNNNFVVKKIKILL